MYGQEADGSHFGNWLENIFLYMSFASPLLFVMNRIDKCSNFFMKAVLRIASMHFISYIKWNLCLNSSVKWVVIFHFILFGTCIFFIRYTRCNHSSSFLVFRYWYTVIVVVDAKLAKRTQAIFSLFRCYITVSIHRWTFLLFIISYIVYIFELISFLDHVFFCILSVRIQCGEEIERIFFKYFSNLRILHATHKGKLTYTYLRCNAENF